MAELTSVANPSKIDENAQHSPEDLNAEPPNIGDGGEDEFGDGDEEDTADDPNYTHNYARDNFASDDNNQNRSPGIDNGARETRFDAFQREQEDKHKILLQLEQLKYKGFRVNEQMGFGTSLAELKFELARHEAEYNRKYGVKVGQRFLLAFVSGIEFVNKKFDPFDIDLDGWSSVVHDRVEDYENVLERLIMKYRNRVAMAPEIEIMMMLAGSALTFHMSKSISKRVEAAFNSAIQPPPPPPQHSQQPPPQQHQPQQHQPQQQSPLKQPAVANILPGFDIASIASRLAPVMASLQQNRRPPTVPPVPVDAVSAETRPTEREVTPPTAAVANTSFTIDGDDDDDVVVDPIFDDDKRPSAPRSSATSIVV